MPIKTLKVRVKDKHTSLLNDMARSVNFVWNYCNELSSRAIRERGLFFSGFDLQNYTKGASKDLGLNSQTVQEICAEYALRRKQFKKNKTVVAQIFWYQAFVRLGAVQSSGREL